MGTRLITGDCRAVLPTLAANSVHCVVTSPPYYGLRDYGVDGQLGLEATPGAWIAEMVWVFREVRRVLRSDGVMFLNCGDSYRGKQLQLMPARLALALQADGWWVRSQIVWAKPNPMPESVLDRPTSSHETVWLCSKSARYFWDADGVREEAEYGRSPSTVSWHAKADAQSVGLRLNETTTAGNGGSRNLRNVWTIATEAFSAAHFATYPTELVERCIRAGTSERGCCAQCGQPWVRETTIERVLHPKQPGPNGRQAVPGADLGPKSMFNTGLVPRYTTLGWSPACRCDAPTVPCTVMDPFAGAGTTLLVADRLQRDGIGIELNPAYVAMALERIRGDSTLFALMEAPPPPEAANDRQLDMFEAAD